MSENELPNPRDILPHREPFLFVAQVTRCDGETVEAHYTFEANDFFKGHFPGQPIVPGVVLLEGLAQTLAYLALRRAGPGKVFLTGVEQCKFRRMVLPGERVDYSIKVKRTRLKMVIADGEVHCGGALVCKAELRGIIESEAPSKPSSTST